MSARVRPLTCRVHVPLLGVGGVPYTAQSYRPYAADTEPGGYNILMCRVCQAVYWERSDEIATPSPPAPRPKPPVAGIAVALTLTLLAMLAGAFIARIW